MGRRETRVIVVRKHTTVLLLVLLSAAMALLVYYLSGKAYRSASNPTLDLIQRLLMREGPPPSRQALLASLMPVFGNMLLFIPWGFLMFLALDSPRRSRPRTYLLTFVAGLMFAAALELWQFFLPTRVTSTVDAVANAFGSLTGAIGGHLRKQVRVQFEL